MESLAAAAEKLAPTIEERLVADEPLAAHTTYRVGGPAERFLAANSAADVVAAWRWASARGLPIQLLGGGSNVIVADAGLPGLVIAYRTATLPTLAVDDAADELLLSVDAGLTLARLSVWAVRHGWQGLEWAGGIPGTLAGAVIQNAGAHGGQLSDSLEAVTVLAPSGDVVEWSAARLGLAYRRSIWRAPVTRPPELILGLRLRLRRADPTALRAVVEHGQAYRRRTQPRGASAGSVFKNPPGDYAGRLLDVSGLKGRRVGGAAISTLHANWIVNETGRATASEILALAEFARQTVVRDHGVWLEFEQEVLGVMPGPVQTPTGAPGALTT